jgi:hypothetical protein
MKTVLRALLALMPLSIGMACLVLCAALTLPVQANAGGPAPAQFTIMNLDRTQLGDDIAHYRYDVAMGPGKYDVVRIHRIVRERRPNKPVSTRDAVMLLPGNPNSFEGIFMAPMVTGVPELDHSIVIFLAQNDIDVWGMDYGWALVPPDETDFEFMGQWGLAKDVAHTEACSSCARSRWTPVRQRQDARPGPQLRGRYLRSVRRPCSLRACATSRNDCAGHWGETRKRGDRAPLRHGSE